VQNTVFPVKLTSPFTRENIKAMNNNTWHSLTMRIAIVQAPTMHYPSRESATQNETPPPFFLCATIKRRKKKQFPQAERKRNESQRWQPSGGRCVAGRRVWWGHGLITRGSVVTPDAGSRPEPSIHSSSSTRSGQATASSPRRRRRRRRPASRQEADTSCLIFHARPRVVSAARTLLFPPLHSLLPSIHHPSPSFPASTT
jgi:hypothetical protein